MQNLINQIVEFSTKKNLNKEIKNFDINNLDTMLTEDLERTLDYCKHYNIPIFHLYEKGKPFTYKQFIKEYFPIKKYVNPEKLTIVQENLYHFTTKRRP